MKHLVKLSVAFSLITSFGYSQSFKISGTAHGVKDNTVLYLEHSTPEIVDSGIVMQEKFTIQGKLNVPAEKVFLHTKDNSNYVFFWLENKPIIFEATDKKFRAAMITGSVLETENQALKVLLEPSGKSIDSLNNLLSDKTISEGRRTALLDLYKKAELIEAGVYKKYVAAHPNSLNAINILSVYSSTWGKQETEKLFAGFNAEMKQTSNGIDINNFIKLNKDIKTGGKFVDFEQANAAGKLTKVSSVKAKYVLLEFWASWCGPCRADNPELVKTYLTYKPKGFEIVAVSLDDQKDQWLKAIKDDKLPWVNLSDLKGNKNTAALIYGISFVPNNFLIDENGVIIAQNLRVDKLKEKLAELLK